LPALSLCHRAFTSGAGGMSVNCKKGSGRRPADEHWWITEAIPIYATAFCLVLYPVLHFFLQALTASNYGHNMY